MLLCTTPRLLSPEPGLYLCQTKAMICQTRTPLYIEPRLLSYGLGPCLYQARVICIRPGHIYILYPRLLLYRPGLCSYLIRSVYVMPGLCCIRVKDHELIHFSHSLFVRLYISYWNIQVTSPTISAILTEGHADFVSFKSIIVIYTSKNKWVTYGYLKLSLMQKIAKW
jgi:hypothetical protein